MNILQILPSLDVGGVETGTIDLARYLARNGHKAVVVSGGGRLVKELDIPGTKHYTLPVGEKSLFTMVMMVKELARIIRREDIDIVHARSRIPAWTAYAACKITSRIFITTAHGYYKTHALSRVMGWGRYVVVASNIMAKHMVNAFGVPHERIRLIPRGVDLERFTFRDPAARRPEGFTPLEKPLSSLTGFTIGMVSRITPLKGHQDFIKAVSILSREIPQLKVLIVGDAPRPHYREEIELLARRLGLSRTIEFLGVREDIPGIMRQLDLLVSATTTPEAFGRVIIEAQACGVPVVSTRVGGVVDIIEDGSNGLLCGACDPRDMAAKISRLYKDSELWRSIAVEGQRRVERDYGLNDMMTRTVAMYEEALKISNILVIKLSALGDVILAVPSLRALRARFRDARIKVLVGKESRAVLDRCPYIDDRIVYDPRMRDKGLRGFIRMAKALQRDCFDVVIDLQNNKRSHIFAFSTLAPLRYGYDNKKLSFLLNKRIKDDAPYLDPIEHQFRVLKAAGAKPAEKNLELWPSDADEKAAEDFLKDNWVKTGQDLVGIHVRASSRWSTKNWPQSAVVQLCDRLARELNIRVVLTGTKEDARMVNQMKQLSRSKPIIAAGRTDILELASLVKRFKVYITPDSAPMHIAAAMGTPFIALFGPTDPARHVPPAEKFVVLWRAKEAKCRACYSPHCLKNFRCMRMIKVDDVFDEVKKFLGRSQ